MDVQDVQDVHESVSPFTRGRAILNTLRTIAKYLGYVAKHVYILYIVP